MDTLILDDLSRFGLRRLHVIGSPAPVVDEWLERAPWEVEGFVETARYQDEVLGIHHLWVMWPAREGVRLADGRAAVVWFVGPGETLRQAAGEAAVRFLALYGMEAAAVWVKKRPAGAGELVELDGRELALLEWAGAPKRFVIVTAE